MPARLGRYAVRRRIGSGGFATVWLAYDEQLDSPVAIKVLAENWHHDLRVRERFLDEARLLRRLDDERLVRVHAVGELADGRPYSVLTWADGGRLRERLAAGAMPAPAALELLAEIAAGQRSVEEATMLLQQAVAIDPSVQRRLALIAHLEKSAPGLALAEVEQLPQAARDEHEIRAVEASLAGRLGMHDRQIQLFQSMTRDRSANPGLWISLGNALKTVGRADEAAEDPPHEAADVVHHREERRHEHQR